MIPETAVSAIVLCGKQLSNVNPAATHSILRTGRFNDSESVPESLLFPPRQLPQFLIKNTVTEHSTVPQLHGSSNIQ